MAYVPPSEDARPRRRVRQPGWMDAYEGYVLPQAVGNAARASIGRPGSREGSAEMTPLAHRSSYTQCLAESGQMSPSCIGASAPAYVSTPRPSQGPPAVMDVLQQLQEDNRRLHLMVSDMRRQIDKSGAVPPSLAQPHHLPEGHPASRGGDEKPPPPPPFRLHSQYEYLGNACYPGTKDQDIWPPPPGTLEPALLPQQGEMHRLAVPQVRPDDDWPLPPPPVALPDKVGDPPQGHSAPSGQPMLVEELRKRLEQLEARLTPAPSISSASVQYDSAPQLTAPPLPEYSRLRPDADSFLPDQGITSALSSSERTYRGPAPSIPKFTRDDPREFARLRLALDNILPADATERFKYQVLCDHLKFEEALLIADSYSHSLYPYSDTMASLIRQYGQPHQLSLQRIAELMEEPSIQTGDTTGFRRFALRVRALVGMLEQLGEDGRIELRCGSHVARLMRKLPQDLRAAFRRYLYSRRDGVPSLMDFAEWLEYELVIQEGGDRPDKVEDRQGRSKRDRDKGKRAIRKSTTILHGAAEAPAPLEALDKPKAYCPYCNNTQHFLDQCLNFKQLTKEQKTAWVKSNNRCWRCGRHHQAAQCRLRIVCKLCKGKHLEP